MNTDEAKCLCAQLRKTRRSFLGLRTLADVEASILFSDLNGSASSVAPKSLRGYLRCRLPEYMLPSVFVRLEAFPFTPNGKIDRAALPAPDPANTLYDELPLDRPTPTQQRVIEILTALLGHDKIGLKDDFFLLGGHSLLGAQLIARLRETFRVELALRTVFDAPTVVALAEEIERLAAKRQDA